MWPSRSGTRRGPGIRLRYPKVAGPARNVPQPARLLRGHPRGEKVPRRPVSVVQDEDAVAGSGQGTGRVQHALQHGVEVQVLVDAETSLAQAGKALLQLPYPTVSFVRLLQLIVSRGPLLGKDWAPAGPVSPYSPNRYKKWLSVLKIVAGR